MLYYLYMITDNQNYNTDYYATLDENFNQALNLFEKTLTHQELLSLLTNGNILQKQISALRLDYVQNQQEAITLAKNLTGQDGKIREAVSFKIFELISQNTEYFCNKEIFDIFLDAIIDVNSNVCRNIISSIEILKNSTEFQNYFPHKLVLQTLKFIEIVKKFDFQDGKYKVNKEVFKLYWCLETIFSLIELFDIHTIKNIILQTKDINEYTIREKTAKILSYNFDDDTLYQIRENLKKDKNYYVRRF